MDGSKIKTAEFRDLRPSEKIHSDYYQPGQGKDSSGDVAATCEQQVRWPTRHHGNILDRPRRHQHRALCLHSIHLNFDTTTGLEYFSTLRFAEKQPIAHCRKMNLFSTRIFGRSSILCPGATLTENHSNTAHQFPGSTNPQ